MNEKTPFRGLFGQRSFLGFTFSAVLAAAVLTPVVGCSSGAASGGPAASATDGGPAAQGTDGGSAGAPAPATVCASYIACVGSVSPPLLDGVIRAYGPSGSCFSAQSADACGQNCEDGIVMLGAARTTKTGWKNAGCNACKVNADCMHSGEVCSGSVCEPYAQAPSVPRDGMACDFGMNACGDSLFCTDEGPSTSSAPGYGQGTCVSSSPQGQACVSGSNDTPPPGFACQDLNLFPMYGPGYQYLAKCQHGEDCPTGTTCLSNTNQGPEGYCIGPKKK